MAYRGRGRGPPIWFSWRGREIYNPPPVNNDDEFEFWQLYIPRKNNKGSFVPNNKGTASTSTNPVPQGNEFKEVLMEEPKFTKNSTIDQVIIIDLEQIKGISDPLEAKKLYFGNHNFPYTEGKSRVFYETILTETASMEIAHTLNAVN